ncbi:hypothetical protein [Streptomyces sp. NPDC102437]|uniref:hypothetical protein n=1 Tax=Streptomyces sp. NPDC102437 TaxID=3366175 RepID=UPI003800D600
MTSYTPSSALADALHALEDAEALVKKCRTELRAAVAADMKAHPELTAPAMAKHLPWTEETVRQIAREYDVPRKRRPTVRSVKPQKRTGGASSG